MRLRLTKRGDYAVRAMVALADAAGSQPNGGQLTGGQIAQRTGIPISFLPQVMGTLVHAGLADGLQGRTGGYRLAQPASRISLLDVVEAAEGDSRRTSCILRGGPCNVDGTCRVHHAFSAAQEALLGELAAATLDGLAGHGMREAAGG